MIKQGQDATSEREVSEVIRAELQFEPVNRGAFGNGHDACVIDEHVNVLMGVRQLIRSAFD